MAGKKNTNVKQNKDDIAKRFTATGKGVTVEYAKKNKPKK